MTNLSKIKIRSSIRNIDKMFENIPKGEVAMKTENDNEMNLSDIYANRGTKSYSPTNKDINSKKMKKKDDMLRDEFENGLRKLLFKYKQK